MLIIEGSDCLGKTTLAHKLVSLAADMNKYPVFYSHMSRPNKAFDFFEHYKDRMSMFAVQDRFHLGGLVWHEGEISEASLEIIEGWLMSIGSMTIVLYASDEKWYRRRLERDNRGNLLDIDTMCKANRTYMLFKGEPGCPIVRHFFDIKPATEEQPLYFWDTCDDDWGKFLLEEWFKRLDKICK